MDFLHLAGIHYLLNKCSGVPVRNQMPSVTINQTETSDIHPSVIDQLIHDTIEGKITILKDVQHAYILNVK